VDIYVIYDHPSDYPDNFVVRRWTIQPGTFFPTDELWRHDSIEAARSQARRFSQHDSRIGRLQKDDPTIIETWI
jgi:hypothetical protein